MKKVVFGKDLVLSPFKMISLNQEKVFLFIIEPAKLKPFCEKILITYPNHEYVYIDMDIFLTKIKNTGLKIFQPETIDELLSKVSFKKVKIKETKYRYVDEDFSGVIIPLEKEYQPEIRYTEPCSGDYEVDGWGPTSYRYYEKKFPVINSNGEMREISFPIDEINYDKYLPNRIRENQKYLVYSVFE